MSSSKPPISDHMRDRALSNENQLRSLLVTFQLLVQAKHYDAAKHVEHGVIAYRREEINDFVCELEQHERERIAEGSSEGERRG